jgi:uncharacterized Fe-S cluster-containing MiaB family protein
MVFITKNALHVSGGSSAHHQELKSVYTSSGINEYDEYNIMNRLQVYKKLPYMNNRIKQVVIVTRSKCVKQEGLLNLLENILENVHLEDRVREGRIKKTNHREQSCDVTSK